MKRKTRNPIAKAVTRKRVAVIPNRKKEASRRKCRRRPMSKIINQEGFIVDRDVRRIYDRLSDRGRWSSATFANAEAYLRTVLRLEAAGRDDLVAFAKRGS